MYICCLRIRAIYAVFCMLDVPPYSVLQNICFHIILSLLGADARFQNTGLERSGPLDQDIQDLTQQYSLQKPDVSADGPGASYAK